MDCRCFPPRPDRKRTALGCLVRNYLSCAMKVTNRARFSVTMMRVSKRGDGWTRAVERRLLHVACKQPLLSPPKGAEISDGPSRAEHGDGVQRRTCVLAREHEASLWMRRRSKPAASISLRWMSRGHVLGPVSCQINWLQILRSSCKCPHRSLTFRALSFVLVSCISV